ncbi:hypothetical protein OMK64_14990 [Cellulomonas fimi]|uniref:hypothetical protein n=1 Tax=Cellulomonas fimi TaxID=1708 RepID=UPI00234C1B86|nr:hypothetical protein [Cellulomonas fimi]MDC7122840.1 hypothetical protein [Cellulomonas fimi]
MPRATTSDPAAGAVGRHVDPQRRRRRRGARPRGGTDPRRVGWFLLFAAGGVLALVDPLAWGLAAWVAGTAVVGLAAWGYAGVRDR